MNIQIRQIPDNVRYKGLTTEELRDGYLLSDFFKKGRFLKLVHRRKKQITEKRVALTHPPVK